MTQLKLVETETATPEQKAFLNAVPPINLFKALAHAPDVALAVAQLGGAILYKTELDGALREIAILRAAHRAQCAYEIFQHERIARDAGVTEEEIAALRLDGDLDRLSSMGRLVCRWADEVVKNGIPSPATLSEAIASLGNRQTMELANTVAYYLMVASLLLTFDVPIEGEGFTGGVDITRRPARMD